MVVDVPGEPLTDGIFGGFGGCGDNESKFFSIKKKKMLSLDRYGGWSAVWFTGEEIGAASGSRTRLSSLGISVPTMSPPQYPISFHLIG